LIGAGVGALGGALINDQYQREKANARQQGYQEGYNQGAAQGGPRGYTQQQPQYNTAPR